MSILEKIKSGDSVSDERVSQSTTMVHLSITIKDMHILESEIEDLLQVAAESLGAPVTLTQFDDGSMYYKMESERGVKTSHLEELVSELSHELNRAIRDKIIKNRSGAGMLVISVDEQDSGFQFVKTSPLFLSNAHTSGLKRVAKAVASSALTTLAALSLSACGGGATGIAPIDNLPKVISGSGGHAPPSKFFEPELHQVKIEFEQAASQAGVDINPQFELRILRFGRLNLKENKDGTKVMGVCEKIQSPSGAFKPYSIVTIEHPDTWDEFLGDSVSNLTPEDRQANLKTLIWHELGHCLLDLGHSESLSSFDEELGVSAPTVMGNSLTFMASEAHDYLWGAMKRNLWDEAKDSVQD